MHKSQLGNMFKNEIHNYLLEDGCFENVNYLNSLPQNLVQPTIKIKSNLVLAGLPFFFEVFKTLGDNIFDKEFIEEFEGKKLQAGQVLSLPFNLRWSTAILGERVALNLLQRCSAIATSTNKLVQKSEKFGIKILDTRKTTPGLRKFEKYSVQCGGGHNHRFSQVDQWMIKDNHKTFFGSTAKALDFFIGLKQSYKNIIMEIHTLDELKEAQFLKVNHFLLDNFSPQQLMEAVKIKKDSSFFEVSGGINENNIDQYLIEGIDAISVGKITQFPEPVDISFKYERNIL